MRRHEWYREQDLLLDQLRQRQFIGRTEHRLVFVGRNRTVTATDDITVRTHGTGASVDYRATLEIKGMARMAAPLVRAEFERLADQVARRLPEVLAAPR